MSSTGSADTAQAVQVHSGLAAGRLGWADLCRAIAIYGIVLIHTSAGPFYQYKTISYRGWLSAALLDSLVRVAVPLFVMLSGALLLNFRSAALTPRQLARRIAKVLFPLIAWSLFYVWWLRSVGAPGTTWLGMLTQPAMYHLWFVYMLVGLYLILPVLHAIYERLLQNGFYLFLFMFVWALGNCVPALHPVPLVRLMQVNGFLGYAGYFILGGILARKHVAASPIWLFLAYLCFSLVTFALTVFFTLRAGAASEIAYNYFAPNVAIAAFAAFCFFTRLSPPVWIQAMSHWISDRAFIVYFVHILVLEYVRAYPPVSQLLVSLPIGAGILIVSIIAFLGSLLVAGLLRLIPRISYVTG